MTDNQIHELALYWATDLYDVNDIAYYRRYTDLKLMQLKINNV